MQSVVIDVKILPSICPLLPKSPFHTPHKSVYPLFLLTPHPPPPPPRCRAPLLCSQSSGAVANHVVSSVTPGARKIVIFGLQVETMCRPQFLNACNVRKKIGTCA